MSALEYKNRKCLFSILDKNFIVGFKVFCASLLENNPWIRDVELELLIVSMGLTDSEKKECEKLYPYILWLDPLVPPESFAQSEIDIGVASFHKLRVFSIEEYDSIISLDCGDMVVLKNISDLFCYDVDIGMVQGWTKDFGWHSPAKGGGTFNGGLVVLNKTYRNQETYSRLINHERRLINNKPSRYYDQQIINDEFERKITKLPVAFNFSKRLIDCDEANIKDAKILHFVGSKPWQEHGEKEEYKIAEEIWHGYTRN